MIKLSKIILGFTLLLLLLWQLPWCYAFFTSASSKSPFILYSPVIGDFVFSASDGKGMKHTDSRGNSYSQAETDSILPFFYARQLMTDGRFPDTVQGKPVTYKEAQQETFFFRHSPKDINAPQTGIYQLLESFSGRVKLESPNDVFRITDRGIEFIDAATNSVNRQKSELFTDLMKKKDFVFPATYLSGNPSVKKDYDEGYLLLDANSKPFHMKQMKGRPYVKQIEVPKGITIKHLFITEFRNKRTIGFVTDTENNFYAIEKAGYEFRKIAIPPFDPTQNAMMVYGSVFDWTIKITSKEEQKYYAIDVTDYTLIKSYEEPQPEVSLAEKIGAPLAAVRLRFTDPLDKFIFPRFGN